MERIQNPGFRKNENADEPGRHLRRPKPLQPRCDDRYRFSLRKHRPRSNRHQLTLIDQHMKVLITGAAGFIGYHLAVKLAEQGVEIVGIDNINDYYDPQLKIDRLAQLGIQADKAAHGPVQSEKLKGYRFVKMDLLDKEGIDRLFHDEKFDRVCHLAAQAGVRYSLEN